MEFPGDDDRDIFNTMKMKKNIRRYNREGLKMGDS